MPFVTAASRSLPDASIWEGGVSLNGHTGRESKLRKPTPSQEPLCRPGRMSAQTTSALSPPQFGQEQHSQHNLLPTAFWDRHHLSFLMFHKPC